MNRVTAKEHGGGAWQSGPGLARGGREMTVGSGQWKPEDTAGRELERPHDIVLGCGAL